MHTGKRDTGVHVHVPSPPLRVHLHELYETPTRYTRCAYFNDLINCRHGQYVQWLSPLHPLSIFAPLAKNHRATVFARLFSSLPLFSFPFLSFPFVSKKEGTERRREKCTTTLTLGKRSDERTEITMTRVVTAAEMINRLFARYRSLEDRPEIKKERKEKCIQWGGQKLKIVRNSGTSGTIRISTKYSSYLSSFRNKQDFLRKYHSFV